MKKLTLSEMMQIALMAAVISVLGYIKIPLPFSPVPITGQSLGVLLAGMVLTPVAAALAVGIFVLLGCAGAPVFAGGNAGFQVLMGPTGGYLVAFIVSAFVIALLKGNGETIIRNIGVGVLFGMVMVYAIGVPWLSAVTGMGLEKAFLVGALPFIPGDLIKVVLASILARRVRIGLRQSKQV